MIGGDRPAAKEFVAVGGQGLGYRDGFTLGLAEFIKAIAGAPSGGPTMAEGLAAMEVASAATQAVEEREWIPVTRKLRSGN